MIFIYEGVDGSGKSIKAKEDAQALGCEYLHNPVDWTCKNPYEEWKKFFEKYKDKNVCVDRSFIGNPIYHEWYGDDSDFTEEEFKDLCSSYKFTIIYCESGTEYEDAKERGEDNLKRRFDYTYIKDSYKELLNELIAEYHISVFKYNWRTKELLLPSRL